MRELESLARELREAIGRGVTFWKFVIIWRRDACFLSDPALDDDGLLFSSTPDLLYTRQSEISACERIHVNKSIINLFLITSNLLVQFCLFPGETIFVHDPVRAHSSWSLPGIEYQSFLQSDRLRALRTDISVGAGSLPVPRRRHPIRPVAVSVLLVSGHVEKPLLFANSRHG